MYQGERSSELWVNLLTSERPLQLRAKFGRVRDEPEPQRGSSGCSTSAHQSWLEERRAEIEGLLERLDLGYELNCLANRA